MLFVPQDKHKNVKKLLNNLIYVPFKFDFSGSQIIYHNFEEDYSYLEKERSNQTIIPSQELEMYTDQLLSKI